MDLKEIVKELNIGSHRICLALQGHVPVVDYNSQTFTYLWGLIEAISDLSNAKYIEQFAIISNFFWKAGQFQYIESIPDYQNFYLERIEMERMNPADLYEYRLTDFKIFDVSTMHPPKIIDNQLIYFTFNIVNGLPYRVVCPFPYPIQSTYVHYQVLPFAA